MEKERIKEELSQVVQEYLGGSSSRSLRMIDRNTKIGYATIYPIAKGEGKKLPRFRSIYILLKSIVEPDKMVELLSRWFPQYFIGCESFEDHIFKIKALAGDGGSMMLASMSMKELNEAREILAARYEQLKKQAREQNKGVNNG